MGCSASGSALLSARLGVLGRLSGPTRLPRRLMGPREPVRERLGSRFTVLLRRRGAMGLCISKRLACSSPHSTQCVSLRGQEMTVQDPIHQPQHQGNPTVDAGLELKMCNHC